MSEYNRFLRSDLVDFLADLSFGGNVFIDLSVINVKCDNADGLAYSVELSDCPYSIGNEEALKKYQERSRNVFVDQNMYDSDITDPEITELSLIQAFNTVHVIAGLLTGLGYEVYINLDSSSDEYMTFLDFQRIAEHARNINEFPNEAEIKVLRGGVALQVK